MSSVAFLSASQPATVAPAAVPASVVAANAVALAADATSALPSTAGYCAAAAAVASAAAVSASRRRNRSRLAGADKCSLRVVEQTGVTAAAAENRTRTVNPAIFLPGGGNEPAAPQDFPTPKGVSETQNYIDAAQLSDKFKNEVKTKSPKKVAIIGGGLSGLACAKYLVDAGHQPTVYEARDILGGKVSAWQDEDGDWIETGLHIFFGAYPNMMNLFSELQIQNRLQWKRHQMIFAMAELPGEFTTFDFVEGMPAPLNFAFAILMNQKMLTMPEKLQTAPPLLPMLVEGQSFIDEQDDMSVLDFMKKYGMPDRINEEVFISMAKALDFIDPDKLSMTVVLTAMNRFLNETDGLQMAFLDGNQTERLCAPMKEHIEENSGKVLNNQALDHFEINEDGTVKSLVMRGGEKIVADEYVSAVPCDIFKRICPEEWSTMPFFRQIDELEGIPVINIHMWFDRKLLNVDHLCFSRSPLLSVYADMSTCCKEYYDEERSMLELVFAPCSPLAGGKVNWLARTDDEIVAETMKELERLFPTEIGPQLPDGGAQLRKFAVVRTPRSVYAAIPGRNRYRPSQETPIKNFTLAGDWTSQKFLGSMEGAVLGGKLAAEVVSDKAAGIPTKGLKKIEPRIEETKWEERTPVGVKGHGAIAFGAGAVLGAASHQNQNVLKEQAVALFEDEPEKATA